jgi:hypothetical protein
MVSEADTATAAAAAAVEQPKPKAKKAARAKTKKAPERAVPKASAAREGTAKSKIITIISRKGGATVEALMEALGWQAHSVRGAVATLGKSGMRITSTRREKDGARMYEASGEAVARAPGRAGRERDSPPGRRSPFRQSCPRRPLCRVQDRDLRDSAAGTHISHISQPPKPRFFSRGSRQPRNAF